MKTLHIKLTHKKNKMAKITSVNDIEKISEVINKLSDRATKEIIIRLSKYEKLDIKAFNSLVNDMAKKYGIATKKLANAIYNHTTNAYASGELTLENQAVNLYNAKKITQKELSIALNNNQLKALINTRLANTLFNTYRGTQLTRSKNDKRAITYARVPVGRTTCAFCTMLASRGFVYRSKDTAGEFKKFHSHCDCMIVASNEKNPILNGYDPDKYLAIYNNDIEKYKSQNDNIRYRFKNKADAINVNTGEFVNRVRGGASVGGVIPPINKGGAGASGKGGGVVSVMDEWLKNAEKEKGTGKILNAPSKYVNKDEINTAKWLTANFGGELKYVPRQYGVKTPDYIWKLKEWELKNTGTNINTISKHLRNAVKQTKDGCVIIDINKIQDKTIKYLKHQMENKKLNMMIIKNNNKLIDILRRL
jgi:DNA-binding ferritin-like protein (Dps family)